MRIGSAERAAAMRALDAHLEAGRLDPDEYGDRAARASMARYRSDLAPLFADLPALPDAAPPLGNRRRNGPRRGPETRPHRRRAGVLMACTPGVALALFVVLSGVGVGSAWLVFLLIPIVAVLVHDDRLPADCGPCDPDAALTGSGAARRRSAHT